MSSTVRPILTTVRFNSTQGSTKSAADLAKRKALDEKDRLQADWDAKVVSYEDILPKTQNPTADTFLIDVREPDEVAQGSIPSSINIPLTVLPDALQLSPQAFRERFGFQKPKHTQEVIFYCRSGKRSTTASDVAKRNGYKNILNYTGSWLDWTERQNPKPVN
ncbi:Rhodanese-like protein [Coprinellus micaceus]|uniref:Rhodanese-like protein n=1 Tax=Coprinellus micaceus TaxID=71717 RepID=A0A4Y7TYR6_COPMI|nr:Rhodanese-like protein [Coprinellus micaceus]